jgi:hypothetical protein
MHAAGYTGQIDFDGTFVTITRRGFTARTSVGKGAKRIPLVSITAVQMKPAGPVAHGFIEFSIGGGNEARSGFGGQTASAFGNENAVVFKRKQQPEFEALRDEIEGAIAERMNERQPHRPGTRGESVSLPAPPSVPAGWYTDPSGVVQRYWDGVIWTEHTAPAKPRP